MTWTGVLSLLAGLAVTIGVLGASRRKPASIRAMLDDSRPCAVRSRT